MCGIGASIGLSPAPAAIDSIQTSREMIDGARPFEFKLRRAVNLGVWGRVFGIAA